MLNERFRADENLVLLDPSAESVHVPHARHLPQGRLNDPVLQRTQFLKFFPWPADNVSIHFSSAGGQRGELPLGRRGKRHALHFFKHLGAGEIILRAVAKRAGDVRQPEHADRAQAAEPRRAVELLLGGKRDLRLDILGGLAGPKRDHFNVNVIGIGKSLYGQFAISEQPADDQDPDEADRHRPLV